MSTDARERLLRIGSLALALALHGVWMGVALRWPPVYENSTETASSLVLVELVQAAPALPAPPPPPARVQPAPRQPPTPELLPELPPSAVDTETIPEPPESLPEIIDVSRPSADTANTQATNAPAIVQGTSTNQALTAWQAQLLAHLQRYRRYPRQAERLRQQGVIHVRFAVDRQGRISLPQMESASGYRLLDEEALATVHRANPVPPPPPDVKGNPVEVVVPVSFYLRRR